MANLSYYGSDVLTEAAVQNSNSSAQQNALILSVIEQLKTQVINCTKINLDNKNANDTLTVELERYKEQVKVLKEGQNLEKVQQLESKLYDANVIKNTYAITIPNSEETLMLAEESRSKMISKQQDLMVLEKKVNTTLVDYAAHPSPSCTPTRVEFPKKLPKAVEQHHLELKMFEVKMNKVLNENEQLLEQVINKDIVNILVNSSMDNAYVNVHECKKCLKLETELLNKKDFIEKETYDKLFRPYTTLENHCISLEVDT
nr:hypothetical protein [Tanacetum cinerariifolium]